MLNPINGCETVDTLYIEQAQNIPTGMDLLVEDPDCFGDNNGLIEVLNSFGGTEPFTYEIVETNDNSTSGNFNSLTANEYTIRLIDDNGCTYDTLVALTNPDHVELSIDTNYYAVEYGDEISVDLFTNLTNYDTLIWSPMPDLSCDPCLDPSFIAGVQSNFLITIIDENGCQDTTQLRLDIDDSVSIYVPNIIYGDEDASESNNTFYVQSNEKVETVLELVIFDRWGNRVFENFDFPTNDPDEGWNATFLDQNVVSGVYVYYLRYVDFLGREESFAGDFTVIQ